MPKPPKTLDPDRNHLSMSFYSTVRDPDRLLKGIQHAIGGLLPTGIYTGDNMFVFARCLTFLKDKVFMAAFQRNLTPVDVGPRRRVVENGLLWRNHIYTWAARSAAPLAGDFVECGVMKGTSTRIVCETVDFASQPRRFHLYDVFQPHERVRTKYEVLGPELADQVRARFADMPNVRVIEGLLPEALDNDPEPPERIALLHLDLNSAEAEIGVLERLFDRVVPGGIILLDDYGLAYFLDSNRAHNAFFAARGLPIVELPTSQGMVVVR